MPLSARFLRLLFAVSGLIGLRAVTIAQTSFTISPYLAAPGQVVHFTDTSSPTPTSWLWTFGDPSSGAANTSTLQNPTHVYSAEAVYPVTLITSEGGPVTNPVSVQAASGSCQQGPQTLCLNGGRFQVNVAWTKPDSTSGVANAVKLTDDSGYFWFFNPSNIEMVVKVLDGCAFNHAYWVFASGLTNVQVAWDVVDTQTGFGFTQTNDQGTPFAPVQATDAFPSSCP